MLWEHHPQGSVSTAFSSAPKLLQVFPCFYRNMEKIFSISLNKHGEKKKGNSLVYFDYQNALNL